MKTEQITLKKQVDKLEKGYSKFKTDISIIIAAKIISTFFSGMSFITYNNNNHTMLIIFLICILISMSIQYIVMIHMMVNIWSDKLR